jgi:hypothetical protein
MVQKSMKSKLKIQLSAGENFLRYHNTKQKVIFFRKARCLQSRRAMLNLVNINLFTCYQVIFKKKEDGILSGILNRSNYQARNSCRASTLN